MLTFDPPQQFDRIAAGKFSVAVFAKEDGSEIELVEFGHPEGLDKAVADTTALLRRGLQWIAVCGLAEESLEIAFVTPPSEEVAFTVGRAHSTYMRSRHGHGEQISN